MASFLQRRWVRIIRAVFRWLRISVWFVLFLAVFAFSYLHLIGLPGILKRPLLRNLRVHGFDAQFSNARLDWGHDLLIDDASFERVGGPLGPHLSATLVELDLNADALVRGHMRVDSFAVSGGRLQLPFSTAPEDRLSLDNVRLALLLLPNGVVRIKTAGGVFHGIQIHIDGAATNVTALRDWKIFHPEPNTNQNFQARLRQFAATLQKIRFTAPPELHIQINADGRDPDSFAASARIEVPDVQTPWGGAVGVKLTAACEHLFNPGRRPFLQTHLSAARMTTPWARGDAITLTSSVSRNASSNLNTQINFRGMDIRRAWTSPSGSNEWLRVGELRWDGTAECAPTNFSPSTASGKLGASDCQSPWGSVKRLRLALQAHATGETLRAAPDWGLWAKAKPYDLDCQGEIEKLSSPKLELESTRFDAKWRAPDFSLKTLEARLYGGGITVGGGLNVVSREVRIAGASDFDPHRITPLLRPAAQHFLSQYSWGRPPKIEAQLRLVLPSWTNYHADWHAEVVPTLEIAGQFSVTNGAFRDVPALYAHSHFAYTNRVWNIPRLHIVRPEGEAWMDYIGSEETHDYKFTFDSKIDPKVLLPLVNSPWKTNFDQVSFASPPTVHGEIWGRWHERERVGFSGSITASNVTARGETVDLLETTAQYTNKILRVTRLRAVQGQGELTGEIGCDLDKKKVYLTNVLSTLDTRVLPRALGNHGAKFFREMGFNTPPTIRLHGSFSIHDPLATDLHFYVSGKDFYWTNLTAGQISGHVDWHGHEVALTNIQARIYGSGTLVASGVFDYQPKVGTDFRGEASVKDVDIHQLTRGLSTRTNRVEGMLDGEITITGGNSADRKKWNGRGYALVHNGLLWDIKVFGIFSPILNAIRDGLGDTRATQAGCTFVITNGVLYTGDLEIRSTGFRLLYRGSINSDKQINARAEAQFLRNTWVLGPVLSLALSPFSKAFEFKITGTLSNPVKEPLYIPKFLSNIIERIVHPLHTLKSLTPPAPPGGAPPKTPPLSAPQKKN